MDGVLSPLSNGLPDGFEVHAGRYDNFLVHPDHGRWLRDLSALFDLVWATAREDEANRDVGPALGLPDLPFLQFSQSWDSERTWKLTDVASFVGGRPFCWIDDDIHADALAWAASRRSPVMLIAANPKVGFTADHRDAMTAFAQSLA